jgi:CheY-like chemotaxis protein
LKVSSNVEIARSLRPDLAKSLALYLSLRGLSSAVALHGAAGLEYLRTHAPPRLVVLDLSMPVLDGWGFLRERRRDEALASVPVLVCSGLADRLRPADGDSLLAGCLGAWSKPVELEVIAAACRAVA